MTACAMTAGMVPMALALEEGSQMQAPLGRAVIGGLVMSTVATLLVIPSIFALVIGRSVTRSPSIYPNDPESPHYDPLVFAEEDESGHAVTHTDGNSQAATDGHAPAKAAHLARRFLMRRCALGQHRSTNPLRRLARRPISPWLLGRPRRPGLRPGKAADQLHERIGPTARHVDHTTASERSSGPSASRASSIPTSKRRFIPKMTAYIEKWIVDIGDKVKKNDVIATLFVPELVENFKTKKADVEVAKQMIDLAQKMVDVANAEVEAAKAKVTEAKSTLGKFQSEVDRWDTEVKRMTAEVKRGVIDPQVLLESTNQLRSNTASRDAEQATILKASADELAREADAAKAKVDVAVARSRLVVADSEEKRLEAWVGYLTLTAPFDGVITARNVNTGDFVMPASGDPSATPRSPDQSAMRGHAALRGGPPRHPPHLRRRPRRGRRLRPHRHQGDRPRPRLPRRGASRHRHPDLLGPQRQEPDPPRRDRPEKPRRPDAPRHVRLRQGDHRTSERPRPAARSPRL